MSLLWFSFESSLGFLCISCEPPLSLLCISFEPSLCFVAASFEPPFFEFLVSPCFQSPLRTSCHAVLQLLTRVLYFTSLTYSFYLLRTFFQNLSASYLTHFEPFEPPLSLIGSKSNQTLLISSFATSDKVSFHLRIYFEPTLSLLSAASAQTISRILSPQGTRGTIILFNEILTILFPTCRQTAAEL